MSNCNRLSFFEIILAALLLIGIHPLFKSFKATVPYLLVYLSLFASPVWADTPTVLIKSAVDQAINTLTDPYLQGEDKK